MKLISLSIAFTISIATSSYAATFRAENKVLVTPINGSTFSVPSGGRFGANGAWCAAADYAQDVLGASGTTRIFVRVPKATNSGPVVFGLGAGGTTPVSVSSTSAALRSAGSNLSIDHAYQYCHDAKLINRGL